MDIDAAWRRLFHQAAESRFPMKLPLPKLCALAVAAFAPVVSHAEVKPEVCAKTAGGEDVEMFTLTNSHGLRARVTTWGATLIEMSVPDRDGKVADDFGFDACADYSPHPLFGSVAGRFTTGSQRRITDGKTYTPRKQRRKSHPRWQARV
jgi:hypothetical protein